MIIVLSMIYLKKNLGIMYESGAKLSGVRVIQVRYYSCVSNLTR